MAESPLLVRRHGQIALHGTALLVDGISLLSAGKGDEAKAEFDEARRLDPSLGAEIDTLLAKAAKQKDAR